MAVTDWGNEGKKAVTHKKVGRRNKTEQAR